LNGFIFVEPLILITVKSPIKRQCSRSMEMQYFWLLDRAAQQNFTFIYTPCQENLADYPTKHHTADIHPHVPPYYLQQANSPVQLIRAVTSSARRGCVKTLADGYHKKIPLTRVLSIA